MREWSESVWLGVSVVVGCAVIVILLMFSSLGQQVVRATYEERRVTDAMVEYRQNYQYDNKEVYPSDAASLIIELQGTIPVYVVNLDGTNGTWDISLGLTIPATGAGASTVLKQDSMYLSTITYDANGAVVKYTFTELA